MPSRFKILAEVLLKQDDKNQEELGLNKLGQRVHSIIWNIPYYVCSLLYYSLDFFFSKLFFSISKKEKK